MIIAIITGKLCAFILHLFGKGATTLPGRLALRLKYNILTRLSKGARIICVTGTNGKTTTCALIEHALRQGNYSYFINRSGANMLSGVTTAFIMNSTVFGRCKKEFAILECDENSLPLILRYIDAEVIAVTNVFRDQLDRYGEISKTLSKIREGIGYSPSALVILNADDPITYSLKREIENRVVTFGLDLDVKSPGISDSRHCPVCSGELKYKSKTLSQLGKFYCGECSYHRITPDYEISSVSETGFILGGRLLSTSLGGIYNLYNFCAAAAVLGSLKIGSIDSLCSFSGAFGRMEKFTFGDNTVLLLLVKNPVGLTGCIKYVCNIRGELDMAFALNDNDADGRDVSWIWDSDFTPIKNKCSRVYTIGTRSYDMALRLKYDGIKTHEIINGEEYKRLISLIKSASSDFVVFSTYTAMMNMRHLFIDAFGGKEFWEQVD